MYFKINIGIKLSYLCLHFKKTIKNNNKQIVIKNNSVKLLNPLL